jgi:hypothetical protein
MTFAEHRVPSFPKEGQETTVPNPRKTSIIPSKKIQTVQTQKKYLRKFLTGISNLNNHSNI